MGRMEPADSASPIGAQHAGLQIKAFQVQMTKCMLEIICELTRITRQTQQQFFTLQGPTCCLVSSAEILQRADWVSLHRLGARLPGRGANFAMNIWKTTPMIQISNVHMIQKGAEPVTQTLRYLSTCVLESLDQTEDLFRITANWQIVNNRRAQNTLAVNDEQTTKCDSRIRTILNINELYALLLRAYKSSCSYLNEDIVVLCNLVRDVCKQWEVASSKTTLLALSLNPLQMRELGIDTGPNQLCTNLLEFGCSIAERDDFSRADEGPVQRIEEEHNVLSLKIAECNFLDSTVNDGSCFEIGGWLLNLIQTAFIKSCQIQDAGVSTMWLPVGNARNLWHFR